MSVLLLFGELRVKTSLMFFAEGEFFSGAAGRLAPFEGFFSRRKIALPGGFFSNFSRII